MVAYTPPDRIILTVGASFRSEPMLKAAERLRPIVISDAEALIAAGIDAKSIPELSAQITELKAIFNDPRSKKHDTPLSMHEVAELMARIRGWLRTLRAIALMNLSLDTPALGRISSSAPELVQGYARDMLAELELRIEAARDMKPRLEEVGLSDVFLGRGRTLARQLKTAIGAADVDPANLHFTVRRLYMRKGSTYMLLKRLVHTGQLAFLADARHAAVYHLEEIEPVVLEPVLLDKSK